MRDSVTEQHLDYTDGKLYVTDADGVRWRVHDADFRDNKPIPLPLGFPTAQDRWFVAADGTRRLYAFKKQDDHSLQLLTLVRRLSISGWVSRERFDSGSVRPT